MQVTSYFNVTKWPSAEEDLEEEPDAVTLLSILLVGKYNNCIGPGVSDLVEIEKLWQFTRQVGE